MKNKIIEQLSVLEADKNVTIFYACESGSRAWGFASKDSDYDIRFLYAHPIDYYLSLNIETKRDVIDYKDLNLNFDIVGWDIRKALNLLRKSNPALIEWLNSPIVYKNTFGVSDLLKEIIIKYFNPIPCIYHYLHMAKGNYSEYLHNNPVKLKKYFYVLRPILACLWIEAGLGPPPMEFSILVDKLLEGELKITVNNLIKEKVKGVELGYSDRIPILNFFIEESLIKLENTFLNKSSAVMPTTYIDTDKIKNLPNQKVFNGWDNLFLEILMGVNLNVYT